MSIKKKLTNNHNRDSFFATVFQVLENSKLDTVVANITVVDPDNVYKNNQSHSCSIANLDDSVCPFMVRKFCYISLWLKFCLVSLYLTVHCLKSVRIRSFSDPYFPAFGLNTERYSAFLLIQSGYEKTRTRKVPNTDTFHTVIVVSVWINFLMSGFHKSYILKLTHS